MISVEESLTINERPERLWSYVSDVTNWDEFTNFRGLVRSKSWGKQFRALTGAGKGMQFGMFMGEKMTQSWEVETWEPPREFAAYSVSNYSRLSLIRNGASFSIAAIDSLDTRVLIRLHTELPVPLELLFGRLIRPALQKIAMRIARRIPQILQNA